MKKKLVKITLIGKTNAGKSTLLNQIIGETISIENKKINTTQELIKGIINIGNIQIVFIDTPGINLLNNKDKLSKKLRTQFWQGINESNLVLFIIDSKKINLIDIKKQLNFFTKINISIIFVFNKIDLINKNEILSIIKELNSIFNIKAFFNISAKYNLGIKNLLNYITKFSKPSKWLYSNNEISNKTDVFITNESTRNAMLTYLHKELPYNVYVSNNYFKFLKNGDLKIKQQLIINNSRYKKIILGKNGNKIKKIRELSQKQISKILNCKTHLYLEVIKKNV